MNDQPPTFIVKPHKYTMWILIILLLAVGYLIFRDYSRPTPQQSTAGDERKRDSLNAEIKNLEKTFQEIHARHLRDSVTSARERDSLIEKLENISIGYANLKIKYSKKIAKAKTDPIIDSTFVEIKEFVKPTK